MAKTADPKPEIRRNLFTEDPHTLSFQLEESKALAARGTARERKIPFSQWLREAVREKLQREAPKRKPV